MIFESFQARSNEAELIDGSEYSVEEFRQSLVELRRVNRYLGGRKPIARRLFPMIEGLGKSRIRLLDVGTGSADIPSMVTQWGRSRGIEIDFVVLDLNEIAAREARQQTTSDPGIRVIRADALDLPFADKSFDFVMASLFLHHFETEMAAKLVESFARVSRVAIIINDLRRHPLAYYSIKLLTQLFTNNRLVRHDAAVSVMRSFTEADIEKIAQLSHTELQIFRHFPYRFILIGRTKDE